jgi:hypothetical protein
MPADAKAATVDILEALLATPPAAPTSGAEAFPNQAALARLVRRIPGPAPARKPEPPRAPRPAPAAQAAPRAAAPRAKRKATHYLSQDAAVRLDAAQARLRAAEMGRVTKSGLVEAALELALDAFEADGEKSPLCRRLGRTPSAGRPSR